MIYFYSATGNTRYVADYIAHQTGDKATDIISLVQFKENLPSFQNVPDKFGEDSVGFLFPIYCWGIPPVMMTFMEECFRKLSRDNYVWLVCTCGDEAGTAMKTLNRRLKEIRGKEADLIMSVIMPNTYVLLPGFTTDKEQVEVNKLLSANERVRIISQLIADRVTGKYEVTEGFLPSLRSAIFPVFEKWGVNTRLWNVSDKCIGCGKCQKVCPASNIHLEDSRPQWGKRCFSCCACFHYCPERAINYGTITKGKSQYYFKCIPK